MKNGKIINELCGGYLDWFDKNYIEDREKCATLIIGAQKDYPFTPKYLKDGCEFLKTTIIKDESLYTHIKLIGDLCNKGVSAAETGAQLREILKKLKP